MHFLLHTCLTLLHLGAALASGVFLNQDNPDSSFYSGNACPSGGVDITAFPEFPRNGTVELQFPLMYLDTVDSTVTTARTSTNCILYIGFKYKQPPQAVFALTNASASALAFFQAGTYLRAFNITFEPRYPTRSGTSGGWVSFCGWAVRGVEGIEPPNLPTLPLANVDLRQSHLQLSAPNPALPTSRGRSSSRVT